MALLFEVYREADIEKETQRFIDPMKKGLVPWICKKIYLLPVAGGWLVHNARFVAAICGAEQEASARTKFQIGASCIRTYGLCVLCTAQARLK